MFYEQKTNNDQNRPQRVIKGVFIKKNKQYKQNSGAKAKGIQIPKMTHSTPTP